ncbi:hypothetical protein [Actinacidiphila glaucinigra]|uniref:hypothetical protein n=1 Tax=Actinacidiphila glaucinigra TaxID=235986 RepID=UPI00117D0E8C|nr:hypothetical protein [Actinacidiphila glaucinigra]
MGAAAVGVSRRSIVQAQSRVVARYRGGTGTRGEYHDAARSYGSLHCAGKVSYQVRAGTVVGFTLHGRHLSHFAHPASYEDFLAAFGRPDRTRDDEAYGDLMGYDTYYWGARKHVRWDAWDSRVSLINLGDFEGNTGPWQMCGERSS